MATTAELMREIHRLRRFARDLQERIDREPKQLQIQKAKAVRQEELARENQEAIKKLKVAAHDKEGSLRTTHNQIAKHQKQLNEAASKKEYDALQTEIAGAREQVGKLEEEILTAMSETEERTAKVKEFDKAVALAREECARFEKDSGARLAEFKRQFDETEAKRKEVEATVPKEVRSNFDRIVRGKGADSFAPVEDRTCGACRTEITAQQYNELLMGNFAACKSCGRILYLPEAPRPEADDA